MRLSNLLWPLFFLICVGVGFLHGYLPQGISKNYFIHPTKIRILTTDEMLVPKDLRAVIEDELYVNLEITVTRDWDTLLAKTIASPTQDLVFLPSYWAATLRQQNLLNHFIPQDSELAQRVSSDFLENTHGEETKQKLKVRLLTQAPSESTVTDEKTQAKNESPENREPFDFLPIFWIKTGFQTEQNQGFQNEVKIDVKSAVKKPIFLLADEDLILKHFLIWKNQGLWPSVQQKKILTLQLDQYNQSLQPGTLELPLNELHPELQMDNQLSTLLIWGAIIPQNAENKDLAIDILKTLTDHHLQEKTLLKTPFSTTLVRLSDMQIPEQRKAEFLRRLQLKNTILIDKKDLEAKKRLKNEFGYIL